MPLDSYSGLKTSIAAWAMRTGDTQFEAQVPDFITLCEKRFNRSLRIGGMEKSATLTPAIDGTVSLPADYLEFRSVSPNTPWYPAMEFVEPGQNVGAVEGGVPRQFTIVGNTLTTFPTGAGTVGLTYYAAIPPLSDAAPTNWLLSTAPDLYLYGSLLEAAPYMEEDARASVWKTYYDTAMADLKANDISARYAAGRVRVQGCRP